MQPERGDVVRSRDPFKLGTEKQRPWLIVNNESHPFNEQQYLAVAISTAQYEHSIALESTAWDRGGVPRKSFVSPWAIHSPRTEDLVAWQGRLTDAFTDYVVEELTTYLR